MYKVLQFADPNNDSRMISVVVEIRVLRGNSEITTKVPEEPVDPERITIREGDALAIYLEEHLAGLLMPDSE